eukprot:XP_019923244.1 PREDICTED: uncharacterized protein LOC109618891 [Crassostrea gigas]
MCLVISILLFSWCRECQSFFKSSATENNCHRDFVSETYTLSSLKKRIQTENKEKLAKMWNCLDSNEEPCSINVTKRDGIARFCYTDMCFKLKQSRNNSKVKNQIKIEMCIREKECHAYVKKNYFTGLINQELPCSITQSESNFARDTRKNISRGTHTVHQDQRLLFILLVVWCSDCHTDKRSNSDVKDQEKNNLVQNKIPEDTIPSNDLWTWLNNGTCPMTVRKSQSNSCLCTSDLCATIKCYVTDKESTFAIQCKIEKESKYFEVCETYPMIEKITGKRIET